MSKKEIELTPEQEAALKELLKDADGLAAGRLLQTYILEGSLSTLAYIQDLLDEEYGKVPSDDVIKKLIRIINYDHQKFATDGFLAGAKYILERLGITDSKVNIKNQPHNVPFIDKISPDERKIKVNNKSYLNTNEFIKEIKKSKTQVYYELTVNDYTVNIAKYRPEGELLAYSLIMGPNESERYYNSIDELFDAKVIDGKSLNELPLFEWEY